MWPKTGIDYRWVPTEWFAAALGSGLTRGDLEAHGKPVAFYAAIIELRTHPGTVFA
jgi:hypothetical protein